MTIYLWHMVAVIPVAVAVYPTRLLAQPAIGSALWWELRAAWVCMLAAVTVPLVILVGGLELGWGPALTAPPRPGRAREQARAR